MLVPVRLVRELIRLIREIKAGNPDKAAIRAAAMARKEAQRVAARKALSNER